MPFKSKAQQKWMFATHPRMAEEWASRTPNMKDLPDTAHTKRKRAVKKELEKQFGK